jgi:hypothetical protein
MNNCPIGQPPASASPTSKRRRLWIVLVKAAIGAALLAWVLAQVHWRDYVVRRSDGKSYPLMLAEPSPQAPAHLTIASGALWWRQYACHPAADFLPMPGAPGIIRHGFASSLRRARLDLLAAAAAASALSFLIVAARWRLLLRIQQIHIGLWHAMRLTLIGTFYSTVIPGTVGGDVAKIWYVSRLTAKKTAALVSTIVDRILGLAVLALLAAAMMSLLLALRLETFTRLRLPATAILTIIALVAAVLVVLFSDSARRTLHLDSLFQRLPFARQIAAAHDAALLCRRNLVPVAQATAISLFSHILWVGSVALIGFALGLPTPWHTYFVYVPLIYILGGVPITPGGIGLIESFFVQFLTSPAVNASQVLTLALLARIIPLLWVLAGAAAAVAEPETAPAD